VGLRVALQRIPRRLQRALGRAQVARFSEQIAQAGEQGNRDAVPRRDRLVVEALASMNERFVVGCGEEETARLGVLEAVQQRIREGARELEVAAAPARLQEFDERLAEKRVIVEIRLQVGAPILVAGEQSTTVPQGAMNEIDCAGRGLREVRPVEEPGRDGQSLDGEGIPGSQDFLVGAQARREDCAAPAIFRAPSGSARRTRTRTRTRTRALRRSCAG